MASVKLVKNTPVSVSADTSVATTRPEVCPLVNPILLIVVPTPGSLIVVDNVLPVPYKVFVASCELIILQKTASQLPPRFRIVAFAKRSPFQISSSPILTA